MQAVLKTLQKTCHVPGTPVAVSATTVLAYGLKIKALDANTGKAFVSGAAGAGTGYSLGAGAEWVPSEDLPDVLKASPVDLSKIYLDVTVADEGVCVAYFEHSLT